jgi:acyl-CoA synthetase (AMP-forming)/AMP-acid ligase II
VLTLAAHELALTGRADLELAAGVMEVRSGDPAAGTRVLALAVVGRVPDPLAPVAWVVPRDSSLTEEDVKQWFLARGPAYAHPRRVFFLDRLPVTGTNKIDRKHLQEEARRSVGGSSAP